jgi:hypothetical protein
MQCVKCDCDNPADALFCIKCGAKIENRCAACQTLNPFDANFCKRCGNVLRPGAANISRRDAAADGSQQIEGTLSRQSVPVLDGERKTAQQLLSIAQGWEDGALLPAAHHAVGNTLWSMGQFILSQRHLELSVSLYDPVRYPFHAIPHAGINLGVQALIFLASDYWHLGFPDRALDTSKRALVLARELSLPSSLCAALGGSGMLQCLRGEETAALSFADAEIHLATEQGFQLFLAVAVLARGAALILGGQAEAGIAQISEGLDSSRASGSQMLKSIYLAELARGYGIAGQAEQGCHSRGSDSFRRKHRRAHVRGRTISAQGRTNGTAAGG